jgi:hypothetical protein
MEITREHKVADISVMTNGLTETIRDKLVAMAFWHTFQNSS